MLSRGGGALSQGDLGLQIPVPPHESNPPAPRFGKISHPIAGPRGQKQPAASHQALTGVVTSTEPAGMGWGWVSGPSPAVYLSGPVLEPSIWVKDHTASLLPPPHSAPPSGIRSHNRRPLTCRLPARAAPFWPAPAPLSPALSSPEGCAHPYPHLSLTFCLIRIFAGAPGRLSRLSVWLRLRS